MEENSFTNVDRLNYECTVMDMRSNVDGVVTAEQSLCVEIARKSFARIALYATLATKKAGFEFWRTTIGFVFAVIQCLSKFVSRNSKLFKKEWQVQDVRISPSSKTQGGYSEFFENLMLSKVVYSNTMQT